MDKREIFGRIAAEVAHGELIFPTDARLALMLHQALDDPDCSIGTAVRLIQAEPLLSVQLIAIANSVAYNRSGQEIDEVSIAVSRLGFNVVRALAMALVTRQMAGRSNDPKQQMLINQLWQHTVHAASLAQVIARHVTQQNPETALFAGIIHEIGGFYMLSRASEFPGLLEGDYTEWLEFGEIEVGRAVLGRLSLPPSISNAMAVFWDGFLAMPPSTLADTLLMADELCPVSSPLHYVEGMETTSRNSAHIEMAIGEETLSVILAIAADEVGSLNQALQFR